MVRIGFTRTYSTGHLAAYLIAAQGSRRLSERVLAGLRWKHGRQLAPVVERRLSTGVYRVTWTGLIG